MRRTKFICLNRSVFFAAIMGLLVSGCMPGAESENDRPNIILIMADDLSPRWFRIYGEKENISTPSFDRLGKEGVCFNTAWATPMCSPTRALIRTGQYGMRTGYLHNSLKIPDSNGKVNYLRNGTRTFAHILKEAGYATAVCGRNGLGDLDRMHHVFDEHCLHIYWERDLPEGTALTEMHPIKVSVDRLQEPQFHATLSLDPEIYGGRTETACIIESEKGYGGPPLFSRYWHPVIKKNGKLILTEPTDFATDFYFDFIVDFMDRKRDKPRLVYAPLHLPHGTAVINKKGTGKVPTVPTQGRPGINYGGNMKDATAYLDKLLGELLDNLASKNLLDNTIILITADNADAGNGKTAATDNGARVPFLAWGPGIIKKRGMTDELVEFSDILPTLADYAGASVPENQPCDGKSLKPFLSGESDSHRDWIASYIGTAVMVRNKYYLIEAADPVIGDPKGRFYYCGDNRTGYGYREIEDPLNSENREVQSAAAELYDVLENLPGVDYSGEPAKSAVEEYINEGRFRHRLENPDKYMISQ